MRNLFQSKNHKKEQSIRLQQELQREEERLFKIEQAKKKILQTRDEEFARRLQQQLELEEVQSSPSQLSPAPPAPPLEQRQLPTQPEPLTDEEFARRLQEQLDAEEQNQAQSRSPPLASSAPPPMRQEVNQTLSDEEYARQLQEQFEFEERELQREQQNHQPASPLQQQQQYAMPTPVLPPREPARTSGTAKPVPSLPSKPAAYHQHSSSTESFPSMGRPASIGPSLTPSTSYSTANWAQISGQQQQQAVFASTTVSSSVQQTPVVNMASVGIQPYPPLQTSPSPSAYHLPAHTSSPIIHHSSPSSAPILTAPSSSHIATQDKPQQQYEIVSSGASLYPSYSSTSPIPAHQQASFIQHQHQQNQYPQAQTSAPPLAVVTALPQDNHPQPYYGRASPQPHHQPAYPQVFAPPQSHMAGRSTYNSAPAPAPNSPVMFVVPVPSMEQGQSEYQSDHNQQQIPNYIPMPTVEQHMSPVNDYPPSFAYPYPPPPSTSCLVQQQPSPTQHHQSSDAPTKGKGRRRDPTPPPVRFIQRPPQNEVENVSPHGNEIMPGSRIIPTAGLPISVDNGAGVLPDHKRSISQDPFSDEHKTDGQSSEEEEEKLTETKPSKPEEKPPAAFFEIKTKQNSTAPSQSEQKEFDPASFIHEEDLIDLNEPEQYDSDDDGSSDDGSVVMNRSTEPVAVATETDAMAPKSPEVQKADSNTLSYVAKDSMPQPRRSKEFEGEEENKQPNDMEREEKKENVKMKMTPQDNRAEIQRRLAEQMKKHGGFTRVDPTFGMTMTPAPSRPIESNKQEEDINEEERVKIDKVAEHAEEYHNPPAARPTPTIAAPPAPPFLHPQPSHTPSHMHMVYGQHAQSTSSLTLPGTGHMQHQQPTSPYVMHHHGSYDSSYINMPMVYPENLVKAGAPPGIIPPGTHIETTNEVPSGDYGYYLVDNNGPIKEDENKATKPVSVQEADKKLPKIPSSDPNHRHITVASVNPGQRVWIRVKPTDTGKDLAQRIHVVATYKSKKILSITSTNGRTIPLDDTPVFEDWNEIVKLEDGAPWDVEWGPMDHSILAGMDFLKQIKATLRSKD